MSAPATPAIDPQTPADPGNPQTPPTPSGRTFTQDQVDAMILERVDQEKRQRDKAAQKAREEAEAKALLDQQKFQELAEQRANRIAELESIESERDTAQGRAERYETALKAHLATQRTNLPAHITALLDKLDPVDQLEWIAANQDAIAPQRGGNGAIPPSPRGQNAQQLPDKDELVRQEKTRRRAAGYYGI